MEAAAVLGVRQVRAAFLDHLSGAEACGTETCFNSKLDKKLRLLPQGKVPTASSQTIPTLTFAVGLLTSIGGSTYTWRVSRCLLCRVKFA